MIESPEYIGITKEYITAIKSSPVKSKSSCGNWCVLADAHFEGHGKQWDYPSKQYFFFTYSAAMRFINQVNAALSDNRKILKGA